MMSTPPSPSSDKFDMLKNVSSEQRKYLERVMEKLNRDEEMAEKHRIEKEKAQQLYESSVHRFKKTTLTVKAVLEPMKKVNNLKIIDPPLPTFSIKGEKKEVSEHSESKEGSGTQKSGVDQRKRPRARGKDKVKEEKSKAASFTHILNLVAQLSAELKPRKSVVKDMIQEELSKLADATETHEEEEEEENEDEDEDDAIAKKQKKTGSSTQGEKEVGEYSGTKKASGTQNSGVAKRKKRRVRGTYRISRRCDLKIIDYIMRNLERESLEGFKASCFGRLLEIKELECQGQLLLHLLWNIDRDASNKEKKLVFKINNSNIQFGPTEFSQITGLRMGSWDGMKTASFSSSSIHKKVFKGRRTILLKDVKDAFLSYKGKGELTLKLALLYFLYGTLLAANYNKMINLRYVDLIEDLHKFNEFPWGQVAYEFLVASFLSTRALMDNSSRKPNLYICGFTVALQIWAYESIPALATHCANRLNISENDLTPLILHWSTQKKVFRFNDLQKFFTSGAKAHLEDVTTDTNQQSEKGKLLSHKDTAKDDTIIILDTDDDDDDLVTRRVNKRNGRDLGETRNTSADSDARSATDSDVDSAHMDELVAACAPK